MEARQLQQGSRSYKRGGELGESAVPPKPIAELPEAFTNEYIDPPGFNGAIRIHTERRGDITWHLRRAVRVRHE